MLNASYGISETAIPIKVLTQNNNNNSYKLFNKKYYYYSCLSTMGYFLVIVLCILFLFVLLCTFIRTIILIRQTRINTRLNIINSWSLEEQENYSLALSFQQNNPPNTNLDLNMESSNFSNSNLDVENLVLEKGVYAWSLTNSDFLNCLVIDQFEVQFYGGYNTTQTNIPIPKFNQIYYFEVKLFELSEETNVGIGIATKPYPHWRLPGYHTKNGKRYYNSPFDSADYGARCYEGDVIGCGYRPRTGSIFFTRNGVKYNEISCEFKANLMNYYPTIGASGPCKLHLNCGQLGFVFIEANVGKWGFAPIEGEIYAPPAYGYVHDTVLLARSSSKIESSLMAQNNSDNTNSNGENIALLPSYDTINNKSNNIQSSLI